jgi:hypothetical protein
MNQPNTAKVNRLERLKAKGQEFLDHLESLRTPPEELDDDADGSPMAIMTFDRELDIAIERAEEALMWAEKHLEA